MNKKLFVEPKIYPLKFSCHAIKVGDTVYTPGVVSVDTQGNLYATNRLKKITTKNSGNSRQ